MLKLLHEGHDHGGAGHHHHHGGDTSDRAYALLSYTFDHNDHHASELDDLVETLKGAGKTDVAEKVAAAQEKFKEGNALLHDALHLYTEA